LRILILAMGFLADVVVSWFEILGASCICAVLDNLLVFIGLAKISGARWVSLSVVWSILLLLGDSFRALRTVSGVSQGLALLNLLKVSKRILQMLARLVVEGSHTELLVNHGLRLAARRTVAIVSVVSEMRLVHWLVHLRQYSVHSTDIAVLFYKKQI
jgi:hypothetical protein